MLPGQRELLKSIRKEMIEDLRAAIFADGNAPGSYDVRESRSIFTNMIGIFE